MIHTDSYNDSPSRLLIAVVLTPAKEGGQAPPCGVDPGSSQDAQGFPARHPPQGGQRPGDHYVPVHRNNHQCYHTADTKQRSAKGVYFTTLRRRGESQEVVERKDNLDSSNQDTSIFWQMIL